MEITASSALALFFLQIWRLFTLESPFFGLKVYEVIFGLFIAELGITALGDAFLGLFDTSAPGAQEQFKDRYYNQVWRERYKRFYK